ncbi:metal ABC transporter ATP-binding protein [Janibacter alkaliphilus]|uniref:Zinc transport system ATP-binding protein n=1 Tax=Janibacter alkaliphilus TaxID=1069963 RepID=A0A852XJC0_9MICO|nr:zinc transport system ATP-binding protein [Janibacter alkaliphilus]
MTSGRSGDGAGTDRRDGGPGAATRRGGISEGGAAPVLSLRHAAFGYGDRTVVSEVTLDVAPGEVVAVLGPNGAGKSTLVKGLLGLAEHTSGQMRLFGTPAAELADRTRIGYVPQRHTLTASVTATAAEIVGIGRVPHIPWWAPWRALQRENRDIIDGALATVGLAEHARDDVATLSGGQQRRVLIARALAAQPDLFVLDEPTAGVDTGNQQILAAVLGRLAEQGATLLIVTHELAPLAGLVTRAVVVRGGRVVYDGPPDDLPAQERGGDHHHDEPPESHERASTPVTMLPEVRP